MINKKIVNILIITIVFCALLQGCNKGEKTTVTSRDKATVNQSPNQTNAQTALEESKKQENKKAPLDALKDAFAANGFKVGENQMIAFSMLGASNGYKFKLDEQLIEIYVFEEGKITDEGKENLEQAKKGSISMSGLNFPAKYINGFVLVRLDDYKNKDKIIETVENFKY